MKKKLKLLLLCSLFSCSFFVTAQSKLEGYFEVEKDRISKAHLNEVEIEKYISSNIYNYALTPSILEQVKKVRPSNDEGTDKPINLEAKLLEMKKVELRKLYFSKHPEKANLYLATPIPVALRETCINGDFENSVTANYTFFTEKLADSLECNVVIPKVPITPTINTFTSLATIIDSGDSSWNSATMQFDPRLNSTPYGNIQIPTLSPNGSTRCVKLNNADGTNDVTTMTRQIFINDATLEYEFSLLLQASGHLPDQREPLFTVKIFDLAGVLIQERCIISEPNCIFNVAHYTSGHGGGGNDIYYTNWICDRIDVSALVDDPAVGGVNATIEFTISDCGVSPISNLGGHFGTVYIDNICGFTCEAPSFGAVIANPQNTDCPDFINSTPYKICGSYTLPIDSTLQTLTIEMSLDGGLTYTSLSGSDAVLSINFFDLTYCFDINPALLGIGIYTFRITETYDQTCNFITYPNVNTTLAVADFTNCCRPTATLTSPNENVTNLSPTTNTANPLAVRHIERNDWIDASNYIGIGDNVFQNGVVYHAGNFVELNPGFEAQYGSQFAAYPIGCLAPDVYVYRPNTNLTTSPKEQPRINLVKISNEVTIYPNPSSQSVTISGDKDIISMSIVTMDGKIMFNQFVNKQKHEIDIRNFAKGIYIVNFVMDDGETFSEKLIKN